MENCTIVWQAWLSKPMSESSFSKQRINPTWKFTNQSEPFKTCMICGVKLTNFSMLLSKSAQLCTFLDCLFQWTDCLVVLGQPKLRHKSQTSEFTSKTKIILLIVSHSWVISFELISFSLVLKSANMCSTCMIVYVNSDITFMTKVRKVCPSSWS